MCVCVWGGGGGGLHTVCSQNSRVDKKIKKYYSSFTLSIPAKFGSSFPRHPRAHTPSSSYQPAFPHISDVVIVGYATASPSPLFFHELTESRPPSTPSRHAQTAWAVISPLLVVHCHKMAVFPFRASTQSSCQFLRLQATLA